MVNKELNKDLEKNLAKQVFLSYNSVFEKSDLNNKEDLKDLKLLDKSIIRLIKSRNKEYLPIWCRTFEDYPNITNNFKN
jgi:hypothetical protein